MKEYYGFKCSQNIASLNVLMVLTVLMTVSHLYQNLENIKSARSLKQASEGVNYCDKRTKLLCRRPLPHWFGGWRVEITCVHMGES